MSMTFLAGAQEVARSIGAQNDTEQQAAAKTAIQQAIRKLNTRNWEFKLTILASIPVVSSTNEYTLTGAKAVYSARLTGSQRTLKYVRLRDIDRAIRDQETPDSPTHYTVLENAADVVTIRIFPIPNMSDTLLVKAYAAITVPSADGDILDVPDRRLPLVLAIATYFYLANRDAENPRTAFWKSEAGELLTEAIADEQVKPDEDFTFQAHEDVDFAYGSDSIPDPWRG